MKKVLVYSSGLFVIALFGFLLAGYKNPSQQKLITAINREADIEIVRKRDVDDLLEPAVSTTDIKQLVTSIQPDGSWPGINFVPEAHLHHSH